MAMDTSKKDHYYLIDDEIHLVVKITYELVYFRSLKTAKDTVAPDFSGYKEVTNVLRKLNIFINEFGETCIVDGQDYYPYKVRKDFLEGKYPLDSDLVFMNELYYKLRNGQLQRIAHNEFKEID